MQDDSIGGYWTHVWAVPCDTRKECATGFDEENCQINDWVLRIVLASALALLCVSLFIYLVKFLNNAAKTIQEGIPQLENKHTSSKSIDIALLVEENNFDGIREFYNKEKEIHGNEPGAICCLKVSILLLLLLIFLLT